MLLEYDGCRFEPKACHGHGDYIRIMLSEVGTDDDDDDMAGTDDEMTEDDTADDDGAITVHSSESRFTVLNSTISSDSRSPVTVHTSDSEVSS